MADSHASANLFAMAAKAQADYNTVVPPSDVTKVHRQIEKTDRNLANFSVGSTDNRGHSTGTPHPTRKDIDSHDVSMSMTEDMSSQLLGERLLAAMGKVTTTEITAGEVWQHVFEMINPQDTFQLPSYDYHEKHGESASRPNALSQMYPSMMCESMQISGQGRAILSGQSSWRGSGKRIKPSPLTFFGAGSEVLLLEDLVQNFFRNTGATVNLYPQADLGGVAHEVGCDFRDFELSINNNLQAEAGYLGCAKFQTDGDPESGAVRGKLEIGDQSLQYNLTIIDDDAYDARDKLQTMASISASALYKGSEISGGNHHQADFQLVHANIISIDSTEVEGKNALRITTEPLAQGQIMPVKVILQNDVESYSTVSW